MQSYTLYKIETRVPIIVIKIIIHYSQNYLAMINPPYIKYLEDSVTLNGYSKNFKKLNITKV
jgi:hypothetical protein